MAWGVDLTLVPRLGCVVLLVVGVLVGGVAVEAHLGVEGMDLTGGLEDQGVDLDQIGVALGVGGVELHQDVNRAIGGLRVQFGRLHPGPAGLFGEPDGGIDVDLGDGVRVLLGHRLDLHPALGTEHPQVELGRAVQGEAGVVLLGDVRRLLHPDRLDDVALDVEPENVRGVSAALLGVLSQLHPARLAPAPGMDLRLHHHRVTHPIGDGDGVVNVVGRLTVGHGNPVRREELLALIFK